MTDTHLDNQNGSDARELNIGRLAPAMGLIGIVLLVASLGFVFSSPDKTHALGSYLFGYVFWLSITLGMFGLTLLHHACRGSWSVSILRLFEAGGGWASLLLMAVLFVPIIVFAPSIYEWADDAKVAADKVLQHKHVFDNVGAWTVRFVVLFAIWIILAWYLRNSTLRQDQNKEFKLEAGRSSWGAAGLVAFFYTATLAVTDWIMSLNSHWYSTMYGPWVVVSAGLGALAFAALILCTNADRAPYKSIVSHNLTKDIGNMLFVLTMLWGYTSLSQLLILWNGNLPETTSYYIQRSSSLPVVGPVANNWGLLGLIIMIGQFFIPFFCLISPRMKRYPKNLAKVAAFMFVIHILDVYMLVVPSLPERGKYGPLSGFIGTDLLAFAGIGAIWLAVFAMQTKKAPLLVEYDNRLQEAMHHAH